MSSGAKALDIGAIWLAVKVLAVGVVLLAVGFFVLGPSGMSPDRAASEESAAIAAMRTYAGVQNFFRRTDADKDGKDDYAHSLIELVIAKFDRGRPLLGETFAGATTPQSGRYGYYYVMMDDDRPPERPGEPNVPMLFAIPCEYNRTGLNTFFIDRTGSVYQRDLGGRLPEKRPDVSAEEWTLCE